MPPIKNPVSVKWTPPTTRVDGSPITVPLNFELGFAVGADALKPVLAIVGTLQPDGNYEAPLSDIEFQHGVETRLALRAIDNLQDDVADNDLFSAWSDEVVVIFQEDSAPSAPLAFTAV